MRRRLAIVTLLFVMTTGLLSLIASGPPPVPVTSIKLLALPSQRRCVELRFRNGCKQSIAYRLYRQRFFDDHWAPENPTRYQPDEVFRVSAGCEDAVTLSIPDSGGRYRFQILYAQPPGLRQKLSALLRDRLSFRAESLRWPTGVVVTNPIDVPPL